MIEAAPKPRLRLRSADRERLLDQVLEHLVRVDQPLVLISQVQRCGGTLLSQLFDGHPDLHVHPHELHIGHPKKDVWPELSSTATPKALYEILSERSHTRLFGEGYRKRMPEHEQYDTELFPFLQPPSLVASAFRLLVPTRPYRPRELFDAYFTAYFNSWLDNRHLRDGPKRWVAGFTPRLTWGASRDRLVADYPDGRLIAIVRDPHDWHASIRAPSPRYEDPEESMALWVKGAHEVVAATRERPDSTLVLRFDDLVRETDAVMRLVAEWLGISFFETLVHPTFNDLPILANSSFTIPRTGVLKDVTGRGRSLPFADTTVIDRVAREPYEQALALARRPG